MSFLPASSQVLAYMCIILIIVKHLASQRVIVRAQVVPRIESCSISIKNVVCCKASNPVRRVLYPFFVAMEHQLKSESLPTSSAYKARAATAAAKITPADDPSLLPAPVKLDEIGATGVVMVTLADAEALGCPNVQVFEAEVVLELVGAVEIGATGLTEVEELLLALCQAFHDDEADVVEEVVVLDEVVELDQSIHWLD